MKNFLFLLITVFPAINLNGETENLSSKEIVKTTYTYKEVDGVEIKADLYKFKDEQKLKPVIGALIDDPNNKNLNAVFLAKNNEGYSDICKIITSRKLKDDFSLQELFKQNLENVFVLISSIDLLKQIKIDKRLRNNLFIELIVTERFKRKTRELFEYAKSTGLNIVASHPAYFLKPENYLSAYSG